MKLVRLLLCISSFAITLFLPILSDESKSPRKYKFRSIPKCNKLVGIYRTLAYLEEVCGFNVESVLDVGANQGYWSMDLQKHFPFAKFFLLEGSESNREALERAGFPFAIALVGDSVRNVTFYKRGAETGNGIFREFGWKENTGVQGKLYPIDSIVSQYRVGPFNFMKIDVQGAEVLALNGAQKTLSTIEVITTEASIMNYNIGGATFFELISTFEKYGFALFDIIDMMRKGPGHGFAVQVDLVFVRKTSKLWSKRCTGFEPVAAN